MSFEMTFWPSETAGKLSLSELLPSVGAPTTVAEVHHGAPIRVARLSSPDATCLTLKRERLEPVAAEANLP
jgi:hypothetical protein